MALAPTLLLNPSSYVIHAGFANAASWTVAQACPRLGASVGAATAGGNVVGEQAVTRELPTAGARAAAA